MANQTATAPRPTKASKARAREAARRAEAKRRKAHKRLLMWLVPSGILLLVVAVAVAMSLGGSGNGNGGAASAAGQALVSGPPLASQLDPGATVPDFSAPGLFGGTVSWGEYRGEPTLLAVWAPWCPHCQKELPVLADVMAQTPNVRFVSLVTSIGLHPGPTAEGFMHDHGLSFPVAVDDSKDTIGRALGIESFPTLYFVARDGTVHRAEVGEMSEQDLRVALQQVAAA
jgi:thiol-disulfide isomerase/thioredoxin